MGLAPGPGSAQHHGRASRVSGGASSGLRLGRAVWGDPGPNWAGDFVDAASVPPPAAPDAAGPGWVSSGSSCPASPPASRWGRGVGGTRREAAARTCFHLSSRLAALTFGATRGRTEKFLPAAGSPPPVAWLAQGQRGAAPRVPGRRTDSSPPFPATPPGAADCISRPAPRLKGPARGRWTWPGAASQAPLKLAAAPGWAALRAGWLRPGRWWS